MTMVTLQPDNELLIERGWAALPASYRIPEVAPTLDEAKAYCRQLAESHYENFHVASLFLPKVLRPHFHAIYAYCRISDDLGDEVGDAAQSLALLGLWGHELDACYEGHARHPVFVALGETIRACAIPKEPFADLLTAFRQDQATKRYASMQDVLGYCRYSANPVGRLVLYACGEVSEEKFRLSDATCTALQLANFWQDVRTDFAKGRVYLPQDDMHRFGVSDETIAGGVVTPGFRALLRHEIEFTRGLFQEGLPLIGKVDRELALDLDLFSRGGLEILRAIEREDGDVLSARPAISKRTKVALALRAASGKALPFMRLRGQPKRKKPAANGPVLDRAYAACRTIAKNKAKNFYYAFVALPAPRRNAICAIYAFMRQADDVADDESIPREERRRLLKEWSAAWQEVCRGADTTDPVFLAVRDAMERFSIPLTLLDELIAGVAMDLNLAASDAPVTYDTFADLYGYCYGVASVVGLVCIRIFGYKDSRAEKLAEETGVAFQLTNILRDVAEDAGHNRVYLANEDLKTHGVSLDSLLHHAPGTPPTASERALFADIAQRAEGYYQSALKLLPLIDRESRPALWVLVSIYHGLLKRIRRANFDVFSRRISVPRVQKLGILAIGHARIAKARLLPIE
ncbi:MAG TPA: squalene synthase HpnC [Opitutaceae bacterium]|jgi:squalene synthase HpnC|nr:squalene synthase HpnC [Opitutaceae bacterium]